MNRGLMKMPPGCVCRFLKGLSVVIGAAARFITRGHLGSLVDAWVTWPRLPRKPSRDAITCHDPSQSVVISSSSSSSSSFFFFLPSHSVLLI